MADPKQLTFADLTPPKQADPFAWLHKPLTREEQAGIDMMRRMKQPLPKGGGPTKFDPEHDPQLQDEFTPKDRRAT